VELRSEAGAGLDSPQVVAGQAVEGKDDIGLAALDRVDGDDHRLAGLGRGPPGGGAGLA